MRARRPLTSLLLCLIPLLHSQTTGTTEPAKTTFKSKVQVVLLDIVATDANGQPIKGLTQNDFEVMENGKSQTIASFEEHRGDPAAPPVQRPPLPPHFYSNAPLVEPSGSVNVLLLDSLNTEFGDQATVRLQMIQYLKTLEPGPRLAIFTLGARLRMVEGFTSDPKVLIAAINHKHWGGTPETSPQLRTSAEDNMDQTILSRMSESPGASPAAIEALQRFQQEMQATQAFTRVSLTLDALQDLSRYLTGFHGRKNIIWFSGSFPQIEFPTGSDRTRVDLDSGNGLSKEMKSAIDMLAAAQIAVYPIAAQGLDTQGMYQAQTVAAPQVIGGGMTAGEKLMKGASQNLNNENVSRYFNQKAADDIAANTGGKAYYNTNGLKEAFAEAVHTGSYYYRISYSPTDKKMIGRYRKIEVKIRKGSHATPREIAYRHGYYEENAKQSKTASPEPATDLLHPLMSRGLPDATEIVYNLRLLRSAIQPAAGGAPVGDNKDLHGPVTRYGADFVIPVDALDFEITSDGVRHGGIELSLVAYDHGGRPLNWIVRSIRTSLRPEVYVSVQRTGVQFHQELDVPASGDLYLRSGVYDIESNRAGTLEIPLSAVVADNSAATIQKPDDNVARQPAASERTEPTPVASPVTNAPAPAVKAPVIGLATLASIPEGPQSTAPASREPSDQESADVDPARIPAYCAGLAATSQHSEELAKFCEFVVSMRKKLPDVICDRQMKRHWTEYHPAWGGGTNTLLADKHSDKMTAKVRYKNGREYYDDVRVDGVPVSTVASLLPANSSFTGTWSVGEFATVLSGVFQPSSKAEFQFQKTAKVGSAKALLFHFHVAANNNRSFALFAGASAWFPEYSGRLWIDETTLALLRLERETAYMENSPIRRVKTTIEYASVPLGDGSRLVLPTHSTIVTCAPPVEGISDNCSRSLVTFANWQRFRATTKFMATPAN